MALRNVTLARSASPVVPRLGLNPFDDIHDAQFGIEPGIVVHHDVGPTAGHAEMPPGPLPGSAASLRAENLRRLKRASTDSSPSHSTPSPASTEPDTNPAIREQVVKKALL